jgi:hypothetical protein
MFLEKANKNLFYSVALGALILLDSIVTYRIGNEANPILLWIMKAFDLTLGGMMFWRTVLIWGAIYFLYRVGYENKYLIMMYATLYGICVVTII